MTDLDRRDFLKVVGLSTGAALAAGCGDPLEKVIPYLNQPEEVVPGISTYYNSTCRECPAACGIRVTTREGRPIKVDGNPDDPVSRGSLCVRGQASLNRTYDAARFAGPLRREGDGWVPITWDEGIALLAEKVGGARGKVAFVGGTETGTLDVLIDRFLAAAGSSNRLRFEPYAHEALRSANEAVFGTDAVPHFALEAADVLVSFGTDFIETWLNPLQNQVNFSRSRANGKGYAVCVGPRLGVSGANADQWLAPEPGTEVLVALALAHEVARAKGGVPQSLRRVLEGYTAKSVAEPTGLPAAKIADLAERIARARAPLALPPGVEIQGTNAASLAAAVQILNWVSGAVGTTVVFGPDHGVDRLARFRDLGELAGKMRGGEVRVLLVHEANPVYAAPQVGFADAARSGDVFTISFSSAADETTDLADLVLPDSTAYESWGDAEPIRGIRRLQQPTLRPLRDTRSLGDVLLAAGRALGASGFEAPSLRAAIVERWGADGFDAKLAQGGVFERAATRSVSLAPGVSSLRFEPAKLSGDAADPVLVVYPSLHFYDGRSQRIAILNEVPDPVIKTHWGSYAELAEETAAQLGVTVGDVVEIRTEAGSLEVPVYPHNAIRPGVVALSVGQGHQPVDPEAPLPDRREQRRINGRNAMTLVPSRLDPLGGGLAWLSTRAAIRPTGERALVGRAQITFDQEYRGIAKRTGAAGAAAAHGADADHAEPEHAETHEVVYPIQGDAEHLVVKKYDPALDSHLDSPYRWGMSVDLDRCTGCNSCIAACAVENNMPVVGEMNARVGREMFWMRVERYVERVGDWIDVSHTPMMCQHCGAAPCEAVCPTIATYHSTDGLNVMVPNRCIGTRFCSNNCPYKARRFNHYRYDGDYRWPENLGLNPDVMVRSKGVMEKCTMCLQRVQDGKDRASIEGREVRDGEIRMACQQACPSEAIVFGNLKDPASALVKLRSDERSYQVFDHLYTRPGVSYMRSVTRTDKA